MSVRILGDGGDPHQGEHAHQQRNAKTIHGTSPLLIARSCLEEWCYGTAFCRSNVESMGAEKGEHWVRKYGNGLARARPPCLRSQYPFHFRISKAIEVFEHSGDLRPSAFIPGLRGIRRE